MNYTFIRCKWKDYIFHRGISWNSQSILGNGIIPGRKENDNARQAGFFSPLNPFGNDPEEEEPHFDDTVPQKYIVKLVGNTIKMRFWIKLSRVQDQGWRFWKTKSFASITYATVSGDGNDRVTSRNRRSSNFRKARNTKASTQGYE